MIDYRLRIVIVMKRASAIVRARVQVHSAEKLAIAPAHCSSIRPDQGPHRWSRSRRANAALLPAGRDCGNSRGDDRGFDVQGYSRRIFDSIHRHDLYPVPIVRPRCLSLARNASSMASQATGALAFLRSTDWRECFRCALANRLTPGYGSRSASCGCHLNREHSSICSNAGWHSSCELKA